MPVVTTEKSIDPSELEALLGTDAYLGYSEYEVAREKIARWHAGLISRAVDSKAGWYLAAREGNILRGVAVVQKLPWDSEMYGFPIGNLKYLVADGDEASRFGTKGALLQGVKELCVALGLRTLFTRTRTESLGGLHALEASGFRVMDTLVTHTIDTGKDMLNFTPSDEVRVRDYTKADEPAALEIGRQAFLQARTAANHFHADIQLPRQGSDRLYFEWIRNALNGRDDFAVVAEVEGKVAGFVTCKAYRDIREAIGLDVGAICVGGVAPWARSKGVYTSLIGSSVQRLSSKVRFVEVGTQIMNYGVQRAWSRLGFRIISSMYTLHWHRTA